MKKKYPPLAWAKSANGFIPHYRFRGMHALGPERPFPQFLQGEQMSVARYFLCLICETVFGVAPLTFPRAENGQEMDFTNVTSNDEWDDLPYMVEDPSYSTGWKMKDGNPDVLGMFDLKPLLRPEVPREGG